MGDYKHLREHPELWEMLEERARDLAIQKVDTEDGRGEEILVFQLGGGRYSVPAHFVREVQPLTRYTPLPATPPFVLGLVNVRGKLLTVLDIRPLLDMAQTPPGPQSFLFIVSANGMEVCLLTDGVIEVRHSDVNLAPALSTTTGGGATWIRGVDQDLNVLIDPPLLLSDPRIIVNWEAE
jgi:purine-binding chemotaxis protein CheW